MKHCCRNSPAIASDVMCLGVLRISPGIVLKGPQGIRFPCIYAKSNLGKSDWETRGSATWLSQDEGGRTSVLDVVLTGSEGEDNRPHWRQD